MKKILTYCLKTIGWVIACLLGLIVLTLVLLYLPPVQDFAVKKALSALNSSGDMHLHVEKFRLSFPLRISADSLVMSTSGMDIRAAQFSGKINVLPLVTLKVKAPYLTVKGAQVVIGTPDSAMYMRASLGLTQLKGTSVALTQQKVDVEALEAAGGDIDMVIKPDTVAKPVTESAPVKWEIALERAELDSINYRMQLPPTIADLTCSLPKAVLTSGLIDLGNSTVNVGSLALSGVDVTYLTPTPEYLAAHPVPKVPEVADTVASQPWSIRARSISMDSSHAIYAMEGAKPVSDNFDPSYIEASDITIKVDSFASRGAELTVPVKEISARERCGIALDMSGVFAMDSVAMHATDFKITTPVTDIALDAMMGLNASDPPLSVKLHASIGMDDIMRFAPAPVVPIIESLPKYEPLAVAVDVEGRMNSLAIDTLEVTLPRTLHLAAQGKVADYTDLNMALGSIRINGDLTGGESLKKSLLDAKLGRVVNVPPLTVRGVASVDRGVMNGNITVATGNGDIALKAMWNNRVNGYDIDMAFNEFPVQNIMPSLGASNLTADISARGAGLDFFSGKTHADASVKLAHVTYHRQTYRNVTLDASLVGGHAKVEAQSANPSANFDILAHGNLAGEPLVWDFSGDVKHLDLRALALSDTTAEGSVTFSGNASVMLPVAATRRNPGRPMQVKADMDVASLMWQMPGRKISGDDLKLTFNTADSVTEATLRNHDLAMDFESPCALDTLLARFTSTSETLNRGLARRRVDIDSLQMELPRFSLTLNAGTDNILASTLHDMGISVNAMNLKARNDTSVTASALFTGIKSGTTKVDTVSVSMARKGSYLLYNVEMNNAPGTFDQFAHVSAKGYLSGNNLSLLLHQEDIKEDTGLSLGIMAQMADSNTVALRFVPYHPIIGYKDWEINRDNIITYNLVSKHLDANLDLHNSESSLKLFTQHSGNDSVQEDINLQISDIKLQDWISINPFAPPMAGNLSADMKVALALPEVNGAGTVSLADFYYDRRKVGDFDLRLDVKTGASGTVRANTSLMVNGQEAITASGNLNDSTAPNPFMLDFRMIRFPLSVANPFLPSDVAQLSGVLNGEMDVTGKLSEPEFNGYLDFDSTTVNVTMLGTPFRFSEEKIPVEDNVVKFGNFTVSGANDHPLTINGTVDMHSLTSPRIDLALNARDMQVVSSQKSRRSQAYGKAFINLDATARGSLSFLNLDANLSILPGTNVTYVMPDAVNAITSRSNQDMVKFVNFNDTAMVQDADTVPPSGMLMNINARLTVSTGTTISIDLSADGKDKVQLQSNGTLNYTSDFLNDQRTTGRLNLTGGFVRYNIPVMGEKMFTFNEGSYVAFNGDMMNPILNVAATDRVRSNVSVGGNNRVVNFDVGLDVTGTLDEMNVVFDLSCPDDITIANELRSMTPEQRANQAMNLLISGIYRSGGTQTISSGNMGTNALFGFLESQLNNWASDAIKGVDISFGINQYDKTVDGSNTTAMNYSYRVSKSLFDDRFKIVVGGNYTTDAEADENFAQNLIADISFEYMLNKAGTKYVRLFRHTGYESILEGEIIQTGVGFVYKKKIQRIGDIFRFLRPKKRKRQVPVGLPEAPTRESSVLPVKKASKQ